MKLRRLHIQRLPGIQPGFLINGFEPGINVIVGPNASGKSSLMRALKAALYKEEQAASQLHVEAVFEDANGELTVTRLGRDQSWQRAGQTIDALPLPEHRFLPCYTLRAEDLLDHDGKTDGAIAERLARELAGGYDIPSVRNEAPFRLKATHGSLEAKALDAAERALSQKKQEHARLRHDEVKLTRLGREKEASKQAEAQAKAHQAAMALLVMRRKRKALDEQFADFPAGMEACRGDELVQLQALRDGRVEQEELLRKAHEDLQLAEQQLLDSGLAEADLDEARVADYRHKVRDLQQLDNRLAQIRKELDQAQVTVVMVTDQLGGDPGTLPSLDPDTIHRVETRLVAKRELEKQIHALDAELQCLAASPGQVRDVDQLRMARADLLSWLCAPQKALWGGLRLAAVMAALIAALIGIGVATALVHWVFVLLLPVLAACLGLALYYPDNGQAERLSAQQRFQSSGVDSPVSWGRAQVQSKLHELDRLLLEAERHVAGRRRVEEITLSRQSRVNELEALADALTAMAGEVGFSPAMLDASLERWVKLLADYDRARREVEIARQTLEALEQEADHSRASVSQFLRTHGEAPETPCSSAKILESRLDKLAERIRHRHAAHGSIAQTTRDIDRLASAMAKQDEQIRVLFERAGVADNDEAALRERIEQLQPWRVAMEALRDARSVEREREQVVGDRPDLIGLVNAGDEAALQRQCDAFEAKAAAHEGLLQEITCIENEIDRVGRTRELEQARARVQQARDTLTDSLEEALFAEAGDYLLGQVASEHVLVSQPSALRRAKDWFQRFTHHQFELDFSTDDGSRFAARETATGQRRTLAELSSGTRMQLILAVRVAFALEAEKGSEPLPLILDEALSMADPERFRAAARSLRTLAEDTGRQIVYLTSQPGDLAYWQAGDGQVNYMDLAQVRQTGRAITDPDAIRLPEAQEIPLPGDLPPEVYAVALGVPPVDPWAEPESLHGFFLLRDRLPLLHRLLDAKVPYVGNLQSLLKSSAAGVLLTEKEILLLKRRMAGLEAWFAAWRHGRGRPVGREALEKTDAVTEAYLQRVLEQCEQVGGDAAALLARLEAGEVKGFRRRKVEALREWLLERHYLDAREPLSSAQIEHQVLAILSMYLPEGENGLAEARLLNASLSSSLRGVDGNAVASGQPHHGVSAKADASAT